MSKPILPSLNTLQKFTQAELDKTHRGNVAKCFVTLNEDGNHAVPINPSDYEDNHPIHCILPSEYAEEFILYYGIYATDEPAELEGIYYYQNGHYYDFSIALSDRDESRMNDFCSDDIDNHPEIIAQAQEDRLSEKLEPEYYSER